jgi:acyl-CoA hydrolase
MAKNDKLITINNCIEVDILGQVNSETSGCRQISGTGGQLDFLTGGYMSEKGKSFICFSSTFVNKKTSTVKSRVVPSFLENTVVTNPRTQAHYFVTEWGIADLAGRSTWERAERIINIAHPAFREGLIKEAERLKIWRKTNKI